jgi:hypothetical protein
MQSPTECNITLEARNACIRAWRMRNASGMTWGVRDWSKIRIEVVRVSAEKQEVRLFGALMGAGLQYYVDHALSRNGVSVVGMD